MLPAKSIVNVKKTTIQNLFDPFSLKMHYIIIENQIYPYFSLKICIYCSKAIISNIDVVSVTKTISNWRSGHTHRSIYTSGWPSCVDGEGNNITHCVSGWLNYGSYFSVANNQITFPQINILVIFSRMFDELTLRKVHSCSFFLILLLSYACYVQRSNIRVTRIVGRVTIEKRTRKDRLNVSL